MSGIYIPDVELPQDGDFELWISIKKDGSHNYNISGRWNKGKRKVVPVPPHGDLTDRNETIKALWKALYEYENRTEKQFVESSELDVADWILHRIFVQNMSDIDRQTILQMPTIIPAEEGE